MADSHRIRIEYCVPCSARPYANNLVTRLLEEHENDLAAIEVVMGKKGDLRRPSRRRRSCHEVDARPLPGARRRDPADRRKARRLGGLGTNALLGTTLGLACPSTRWGDWYPRREDSPLPHIDLPEGVPGIRSAMMFRPETAKPLLELAETLLRGENTLSRGERELIAATSRIATTAASATPRTARSRGRELDEGADARRQVAARLETAPVSEKLRALLAIAAQSPRAGSRSRQRTSKRARDRGRHRRRDPRHRAHRRRVLHVQPLRRRARHLDPHGPRRVRRDGPAHRRRGIPASHDAAEVTGSRFEPRKTLPCGVS